MRENGEEIKHRVLFVRKMASEEVVFLFGFCHDKRSLRINEVLFKMGAVNLKASQHLITL